jgi:hypothetical protein
MKHEFTKPQRLAWHAKQRGWVVEEVEVEEKWTVSEEKWKGKSY